MDLESLLSLDCEKILVKKVCIIAKFDQFGEIFDKFISCSFGESKKSKTNITLLKYPIYSLSHVEKDIYITLSMKSAKII
jgi:hypothetical protein